ncbi:MAG: T9SS type A sorting domain-containing protein [Ignavibacteria bacterium]|nr:T9SS type A sorting domain-containing protein [Ignavibacteria bacterium]
MRIKIESEFLPIPRLNYEPLGRAQTTTHHKVIRLTTKFLSGGKMKLLKLILLFYLTLFLTENIFAQVAVDIQFLATNDTITYEFAVGLDLTATNCIDTLLGECGGDPPPWPPTGIFDIRIDLTPYGCGIGFTCNKDYRPPGNPPAFPFTGIIEHTLWYQTSSLDLDIDITYNLPVSTQMYIIDQFGGTILNLGPFIGQGTATIPGTYTAIFNKVILKMEYDNIVPVELISFTASILQNEKAVQLNWTTATETNNSGFEIERKELGVGSQELEWEAIGFVPGFGTTTEPKSYSFIDDYVSTGNYKYRLRQIDLDGIFEYSNEIEVEIDFTPKEFVLYQNYPNPFNPNTVISYQLPVSSNVTLKIYDVLGNEVAILVNEEKQPGVYEVEFNCHSDEGQNLSSGFYFYQLKAEGFVQTKKMILLR